MFRRNHIYYRFTKGEVTATHIETNQSATKLCPALSHPRTLMGDFYQLEACVIELTKQVFSKSIFDKPPIVIIQLFGVSEGGYTNVEIRAFKEVMYRSKVKKVCFADTEELLSAVEITTNRFPKVIC
ncbi:hypothetical protein SAMN04488136_12130 [Vibrio xiamenensis]|uniref:Uncharacterized protein n=1 Tax=Vibrio xiamenensis TaxID=861298 RepID=A0A1G8DS63_9VIBR|nr:hypothetical protein [Vibrio xiamenensis]SDH60320.1 hypothetical protein SAMN04488136_12130 [Vibrio xiamenensis]